SAWNQGALTLDSATRNVGIGTLSPGKTLHVGAGTNTGTDSGMVAVFTNVGNTDVGIIDSSTGVEVENWAGAISSGGNGGSVGTVTNHNYQIITNNTARIVID